MEGSFSFLEIMLKSYSEKNKVIVLVDISFPQCYT